MNEQPDTLNLLQQRIQQLEQDIAALRKNHFNDDFVAARVPEPIAHVFRTAQQNVSDYFRRLSMNPAQGTIEVNDERYVLVRAAAFSKSFLETIQRLYADRPPGEAFAIGRNFLFDYAHVIGMDDARNFHKTMNLTDPIERLSAGPMHFAFTGWAFVDIDPVSNPSPDENFFLRFTHPYSFEADSWIREKKVTGEPVCIMNAGYAAGWCEESFGISLTAVEIRCAAKGDECCEFIMAPPHKVADYLPSFHVDDKGNPPANISIPTLFERKRMEEEMERARRLAEAGTQAKSDFVANVSHELRTPLGSILGFATLLSKTNLDAVQRDYLDAICSSGKGLLDIVNNVLDLSRIDAGQFPLDEVTFHIRDVMESVRMMFSSAAATRSIRLDCLVDDAIYFPVACDATRLKQVLINLVGNAVKFTKRGSVSLRCVLEKETPEEATIRFLVVDTGIGIPADRLETIFERFSQADASIAGEYGGTGLGLAIVKQLVGLLGGSVSVESSESGTTFFFAINVRKSSIAVSPAEDSRPVQPSTDRGTVLIVDDNMMNRKLATIILRQNGFDTAATGNGREAVRIMQQRNFDVVLLDLQMPEMDGYETIRFIRDELKSTIRVVATTALTMQGEREKCIAAGMDDYLAKPFTEAALLDRLSALNAVEQGKDHSARLDTSFLMRQTKNNQAFVDELEAMFLRQLPVELEALAAAVRNRNYTDLYKAAHLLRNSISIFSIDENVMANLLALEAGARAGAKWVQLDEQWGAVNKNLQMFIRKKPYIN
ncbi:MAG: response regulator [Chitinophagaceae bacterium]|nr:MAG: response regulator [Chitinophagaceae bacterium]